MGPPHCLPNYFCFLFLFVADALKIHQRAITYMQAKAKSAQDPSIEVFSTAPL